MLHLFGYYTFIFVFNTKKSIYLNKFNNFGHILSIND